MKDSLSINSLAISLLLTAACDVGERPQLDTWLGANTVYNTEKTNNYELNANLANANLANANLANANLANANLANAALANVEYISNLIANHVTFSGAVMVGMTLEGEAVNSVTVSDGTITGIRATDSAVLGGSALKNAILKGQLSNLSYLDLRIDDVVHDDTYNADFYVISMSVDKGFTWGPLCPSGAGAIPLANLWSETNQRITDPNLFTFACDNAALAKCFKWGYDPNKTQMESDGQGNSHSQLLADWHQACTRLVTADYCGDGVSHTRTGTAIDIYDNLNIQVRSGSLRGTEADWAIDGGHCIRQTRWVDSTGLGNDYDYVAANCPSRLAANDVANCGTDPNQAPNIDITSFPSANGYSVSTSTRSLLRNDSYGYLP